MSFSALVFTYAARLLGRRMRTYESCHGKEWSSLKACSSLWPKWWKFPRVVVIELLTEPGR